MRFKKFYESVEFFTDDKIKSIKEVISIVNNFGNRDLMWRGFNTKNIATPVIKIINDRNFFKGQMDPIAEQIVRGLKISNPSFASFSQTIGRLFGEMMIMVPVKPFVSFQSKKLKDLLYMNDAGKNNIDKIIDSYIKTNNDVGNLKDSEIIFDIKEYWMIKPSQILFTIRDAEKKSFNNVNQLKTYKDAGIILNEYMDYVKNFVPAYKR